MARTVVAHNEVKARGLGKAVTLFVPNNPPSSPSRCLRRWQKEMILYLLLAVSIMTAILWRVELHFRWGWTSLDWIGPFHWAFPLGIISFLAWMSMALKDENPPVRLILLATTFVLGLVAYFGGSITMMWAYSRWLRFSPRWQALAYTVSPEVLYTILGAAYFLIVHRLLSPSRSILCTSVLVYTLAFPIAICLLWALGHIGGHNTINAIKSGFVFPIVAFSLGLPLIKENSQPEVSADG